MSSHYFSAKIAELVGIITRNIFAFSLQIFDDIFKVNCNSLRYLTIDFLKIEGNVK